MNIDGDLCFAAGDEFSCTVFSLNTGKRVFQSNEYNGFWGGEFLNNDRFVLGGNSGTTYLFSLSACQKSKEQGLPFKHIKKFNSVGISSSHRNIHAIPNTNLFLCANYDRKIYLYDTDNPEKREVFEGHTNSVFDVTSFSGSTNENVMGTPKYLFSGSDDRTVRVFDFEKRELFSTIGKDGNVFGSIISTIEVNEFHKMLFTGNHDGMIRCFDPRCFVSRKTYDPKKGKEYIICQIQVKDRNVSSLSTSLENWDLVIVTDQSSLCHHDIRKFGINQKPVNFIDNATPDSIWLNKVNYISNSENAEFLYGGDDGLCMIYSARTTKNKVLLRLDDTEKETELINEYSKNFDENRNKNEKLVSTGGGNKIVAMGYSPHNNLRNKKHKLQIQDLEERKTFILDLQNIEILLKENYFTITIKNAYHEEIKFPKILISLFF